MEEKKGKTKVDIALKQSSSPPATGTLSPPLTRKQIDRLRGRFKGKGLLQALEREKREGRKT